MNINVKIGTAEKESTELLVFYVYEDTQQINGQLSYFNKALNNAISELIKKKEFIGNLNNIIILPTYGKTLTKRIMLVGLGKAKDFSLDKIRQVAGTTVNNVCGKGIRKVTCVLENMRVGSQSTNETYQAFTEGCLLGLYKFEKYKNVASTQKNKINTLTLLVTGKKESKPATGGVQNGKIIAEAVNFTRDLVNTPPQDKTPVALANIAKILSKEANINCKVLSVAEMKKLGMGGILGVAQGSIQPPKFIIIEYDPKKKKQDTIVLVGKGITFDSGGICLKPAKSMDQMKTDMSGAATVLGTMKAISLMKLPQRVIGLVPCTENMPSGSAIKPGDIVKFYSGKTAEVINTDAEGRLILADALAYAEKFKPQAVIDLATLTGACMIALGKVVTGMMGNNEELKKRLKNAGENSWERVWELPLYEDYQEQIKSDIADIKNTGGPYAGAITAACFLSNFTEKYPWVHLDIAGTSWSDKNSAYTQKGATGVGVRLLVHLIQNWAPLT